MAYQALYRVWRPQTFHDVVGQEHITRTLQNALLQEKFSHAYLFSGPRGTGKTSAAKILAKAVNCENQPASEPCNECDSCLGITNGIISDVIEIDAASNNGVEEIRDIRDKVKYAPSSVRYKVYIIDEVHMLSIGAFNALLKTLEEPPKHVMFILATTEQHKIPLTIISRCQRFEFKRISTQSMVERMKEITDAQDIVVEESALPFIAKAAEGGMRDALSLLDQAISFSSEQVTVEDVLSITGAVSYQFLTDTAQALLERDIVKALHTVDELIKLGKEPTRFIEDLIFYFRDMLLYKTAPNLEGMLEHAIVDDSFKNLVEQTASEQIHIIIGKLNESQQEMKWTNHPKIFLELALVTICQQPMSRGDISNIEIEPLLERVNQLELELERLKKQGLTAVNTLNGANQATEREKKTVKSASSRSHKTPIGPIKEMLKKEATKQDLASLSSQWGEFLDRLKSREIAAQAMLIDAQLVAASKTAFVLAFKHDFHCQMATTNKRDIIETVLKETTGQNLKMLSLTLDEWEKVKQDFIKQQKNEADEPEEDPLIAEAKKLFGSDIIEIKD